jgi:hypothetical protein
MPEEKDEKKVAVKEAEIKAKNANTVEEEPAGCDGCCSCCGRHDEK